MLRIGFKRAILLLLYLVTIFGNQCQEPEKEEEARDVPMDIYRQPKARMQELASIPYGERADEINLVRPRFDEEVPKGISTFLIDGERFMILDEVRNVIKEGNVSDFKITGEISVPAGTHEITVEQKQLKVFNAVTNSWMKRVGQEWQKERPMPVTAPIFRKNTVLPKMRKPGTIRTAREAEPGIQAVEVMKENATGAVVTLPDTGRMRFKFDTANLASIVFITEDENKHLHFTAEFLVNRNPVIVDRFWIKTDREGALLNLAQLPVSEVILPFRDIQITEKGELYFIMAKEEGLSIMRASGDRELKKRGTEDELIVIP